MTYYVKKRSGESNDKLIRRLGRLVQNKLKKLKEERFFSKKKRKRRVRDEAIKAAEYKEIRQRRILLKR